MMISTLPPSYFSRVKNRADWESADRSDTGHKEFGVSFPISYSEHKKLTKEYKRSTRNSK